ACSSVTSSVVANYLSPAVSLVLRPGPETTVVLEMQRNHAPNLNVDFQQIPMNLGAGANVSFAIMEDRTVKQWGTSATIRVPTTVAGLSNVAQIVGGDNHACARFVDGTVRCWGNADSHGQLGDGRMDVHHVDPPGVLVAGLTGVTKLSTGGDTTCAVQ